MNTVALFFLGLIMVVFQTTVFRLLAIPHLKAPLFLSVVIYGAFYMETTRALVLAFVVGYAMDVYAGGVQGITPMVMVVLCLLGQWMKRGIFVEGKLALSLVAFGFGILHSILFMAMQALVEGGALLKNVDLLNLFIQSLILAVACPVLVVLAANIDRWTTIGWRRLQGLKT